MAKLDHLQLIRTREPFLRRKTGGGSAPPKRGGDHGSGLKSETEAAVAAQRAAKRLVQAAAVSGAEKARTAPDRSDDASAPVHRK